MPSTLAPAGLLAGQPQRVRVGLRNETATPWSREGAGAISLHAQLVQPGAWQPLDHAIDIQQMADIPALGSGDAVAELPPLPAGAYELLTRIRFGEAACGIATTPLLVLPAADYAQGRVELAEDLPPLPAGARVTLPVRLTNLSAVAWLRWPHRLQLWARLGEERGVTPVMVDIEPGGEAIIGIDLVLPPTPGRHRLRLSLTRPRTLVFAEHASFQAAPPMLELRPPGQMELAPRFQPRDPVQLLLLAGQEALGVVGQPVAVKLVLQNEGPGAVDLRGLALARRGAEATERREVLEASIAPGGRRAFEVILPPPAQPAQEELTVTALVRLRFGEEQEVALGGLPLRVQPALLPLALAVTALQQDHPPLLGEEEQPAAFRFLNEGDAAIQGKGVDAFSVSQRWTRLDEKRPAQYRGGQRVPLEIDSGAAAVVALALAPPPDTGLYKLEIVVFRQPEDTCPREEARCEVGEYRVSRVRELAFAEEKLRRRALAAAAEQSGRLAYRAWCETADSLAGTALERALALPVAWPHRPLVSVLLLAEGSTPEAIGCTAESLLAQVYPHWELRVAHGRGGKLALPADSRILPCAASARGPAALLRHAAGKAEGEWLLWLRPGDRLAPAALLLLLAEALRRPALRAVYSDRDALGEDGGRCAPAPLADFDPDFALGADGLLHGALVAADSFHTALAALPANSPLPALDWQLRLMEALPEQAIGHLRHALLHLGAPLELPPAEWSTAAALVAAHLARRGQPARVMRAHDAPCFRLEFPLPAPAPRASILIPTRDGLALLAACIGSILERTDYPDYEIIVVDNGSTDPATLAYLAELEARCQARILRDPGDFNWARANNDAARLATGDVLCLLNNDTEVLDRGWLRELVAQACRREIGVVGPALWYPNGLLQHGGVMFDAMDGRPVHMLLQVERAAVPSRMRLARRCSAVTGACLVVRREVYEAVGGMDQVHLPIGYNDIDFCLRVRHQLGLATLWTPFAELLHKESASRGTPRTQQDRDRHQRELAVFRGRWRDAATADPFADATLLPMVGERAPPPPGVATRYNRARLPRRRPLLFLHLPRSAGVTLRDTLRRDSHGLAVADLSPRLLLGEAGEELRALLAPLDVLVARCGPGFGAALGWGAVPAVVLRDPVARVASQARFLREDACSPLRDAGLAEATLEVLLKKGVLRGNLAVHRLLGEAPEPVDWAEVDGIGAEYAGFHLPPALWRRDPAALLAAPDRAPDDDMALVDHAMALLERDFAFVGQQDALAEHLGALLEALGGEAPRVRLHLNRGGELCAAPTPGEAALLVEWNRLDIALLERVRALPGGMLLRPERLATRPRDGA